jgi:histidine triad (HIT) family protein
VPDCLFCNIIAGFIPAQSVYEDDLVVAIQDIVPKAPHHLLLIPRKHIVNCLDISEDDRELIGHIHMVAAKLARDRGVAESGFRIVTNTNADAGQSVFHIHFHFLAGRHLQWPPG